MTSVDRASIDADAGEDTSQRLARAEIARLSLAVRAAQMDTELREQAAVKALADAQAARSLLELALAQLVDDRRRACQLELAEARAAARHDIEDARSTALSQHPAQSATVKQATTAAPAEPFRLRVVGAAASELVVEASSPWSEPPAPEDKVAADDAEAAAEPPRGEAELVSRDELRELVQTAVVAALADATDRAVATMRLVPALTAQLAPGPVATAPIGTVTAALPVDRAADSPMWRRLAHADVLLPLVAAVIVILIVLAWVG